MGLNLLNLYSFIFATFSKVNNMTNQLKLLKPNESVSVLSTPSFRANTEDLGSWYEPVITSTALPIISTTLGMGAVAKICFKVMTNCTDQIMNSNSTKTFSTVATILLTTQTVNSVSNNPLHNTTNLGNDLAFLNNTSIPMFNNSSLDLVDKLSSGMSSISEISKFHTLNESISSNIVKNRVFVQNDPIFNTSESDFVKLHLLLNSDDKPIDYLDQTVFDTKSEPTTINEEVYSMKKNNERSIHTESTSGEQEKDFNNSINEPCYTVRCIEKPVGTFSNSDTISNPTESFQQSTKDDYDDDNQTPDTTEPDAPLHDLSLHTSQLDLETRRKLRNLCWETMFGQELVKLTIMDLILTIASILMMDFFRALFVRVMNNCWCWDLEKTFPQYGDFKIAENILHLVNNQGMVWMGMFFSPALPLINLLKLTIIMYLRSWTVLTCNVPHEVVFRASRSNNFYFALLLTMLFLCVLPVGYAIVWVEPSWHCGPFSNNKRIYHLFTRSLKSLIPKSLHRALDYIASPGIVIPLLMLLTLIIYYLISLTNALREANNDLKIQLRRERTEERRKMFQLADKQRYGNLADTPYAKWKKILPAIPIIKSADNMGTRKVEVSHLNSSKKIIPVNKAIEESSKQDVRKSSATSDEGISTIEDDYGGLELKSLSTEKAMKPGRSKLKNLQGVVKNLLSKPNDEERELVLETVSNKNKNCQRKRHKQSSGRSKQREREDSVTSGWSVDNIPEIRISETDSINSKSHNEFSRKSDSSSTDTIIMVDTRVKNLAHNQNKLNGKNDNYKVKDFNKKPSENAHEPSGKKQSTINEINKPTVSCGNEKDVSVTQKSEFLQKTIDPKQNLNSDPMGTSFNHQTKTHEKDININDEVVEIEESISSEGENYDSIAKSVREFSELNQAPNTGQSMKELTFMDQS